MQEKELVDHYVIAPSPWESDGLKFRRHRLVEKLLEEQTTKNIYWLFPLSLHNKKQINSYFFKPVQEIIVNDKKITSVSLFDMKGLGKNQNFINPLDKKVLNKIISSTGKNKKYLWFTTPAFYKIMDKNFQWNKIVYDCSDLWSKPFYSHKGIFGMIDKYINYLTKKAEIKIVKEANVLFTTSSFLAENLKNYTSKEIDVIENGVEFSRFKNAAVSEKVKERFANIPHPRIGFIGGLKEKIDFQLILDLAVAKKDASIVLVGPTPRKPPSIFKELIKEKNVFYLGPVDSNEVPQYIKSIDLGILPYKSTEYNKAISPLKLFEYLACGVPAVGTGLPITEKHSFKGSYSHVNNGKFIDKCSEILIFSKNEFYIKERIDQAQKNDWSSKLDQVLNIADIRN